MVCTVNYVNSKMFEIYCINWKILWARLHHIGSIPPLLSATAHRLALTMSLSEERTFVLEVIDVCRSQQPFMRIGNSFLFLYRSFIHMRSFLFFFSKHGISAITTQLASISLNMFTRRSSGVN